MFMNDILEEITKMTTTTFEERLKKFDMIEGVKPEADEEFIKLFIDFLRDEQDELEIFEIADGAYFGKQITIGDKHRYYSSTEIRLEIAYDDNNIVVYTANHNGYWVPPYISLTSKDGVTFYNVRAFLFIFIRTKMGIN